jgi:radical SAM-linked protein
MAAPEPRQRWRLTFARAGQADGATQAGREYIALWETALADSGLPVGTTDAGRLRFALGAPLPSRTTGRAELADLWLVERVAAWRVREALDRVMPHGHGLVGLEDVWLGAPALSGRVAAADYLVELRGPIDRAAIEAAADRLLAADRLVRERAKGGGMKTYDLRPLLVSVEIDAASVTGGGPLAVRFRTRIHPELGSGRPEEVIAALAEEHGAPLEAVETTRERLVLVDELERGRAVESPDQPALATSARPGRN